jgi:hypothetical protein
MEEKEIPSGPHIESVLKYDIDKYIGMILSHPGSDSVRSAGEIVPGTEAALEAMFPDPKERPKPGTPKEHFPEWRKRSYEEEVKRWKWKYENSIKPPEEIRQLEIDRVCRYINKLYPLQIQSLFEEELTQDYYEMATLIGKLDYLKSLPSGDSTQTSRPGSVGLAQVKVPLTYAQIALIFRYDKKQLDMTIAAKELRKHPHLTSEKELLKKYNGFRTVNDRVNGLSKRQIPRRIRDINAAVKYLKTDAGKQLANADLKDLKNAMESD